MGQYRTEQRLASRSRPQPEFYQLSIFLKVAETRSFTATARLTGRTQPAISQAIARLEDIYGGDLFERRRGAPLALTPIGEAILPSARALIETLDHQMTHAARTAQSKAGAITLGVDPGLAAGPHRHGVADFIAARPEVRLRMIEADHVELSRHLHRRDLDLMITTGAADVGDPALARSSLWSERLFVALPARHELASRHQLDWGTVAQLPLIVGAASGSKALRSCIRNLAQHDLGWDHRTVSFDVLLDMVGLGMGASIVFGLARVTHRDVVFRPIAEENACVSVKAVWRKHDGNPLRHRLLNHICARVTSENRSALSAGPLAKAPAPDHG